MHLSQFGFLSLLAILVVGVYGSDNGLAKKPLMGWSSWSLSAIKNHDPYGGNWLTADRVKQQSDAMKSKLQSFGYEYINIDSFWANDPTQNVDNYGRWEVNTGRFPNGFVDVANHVHANGQKVGIYLNPGIAKAAVDKNVPIESTSCHAKDIVVTPMTKGNTFGDTYLINFTHPCAQDYINSFAKLLASWGVDYLKLDAVSPGSGDNSIDNRPDVKAWAIALQNSGRPIYFTVSWHLNIDYATWWQQYANGWRVEDDVECYCNSLVSWDSVQKRFLDVQPWIKYAGPGGWNDLDSVDVGNGIIAGITDDERQSYATLWAISAVPFYTGNDLTDLDNVGLSLLTNSEVIAVNQQGRPASPTSSSSKANQQIWFAKMSDSSYTVALFNLGSDVANVTASWNELGFTSSASVRDLWSHTELGTFTSAFSAKLNRHASRLLKITPMSKRTIE